MYLNTKYIWFFFLKGIKIQNSILYFKYMYLKYCPSLVTEHMESKNTTKTVQGCDSMLVN